MARYRAKLGDCLEVMREIPDNSFHAVVTDPPYGLSFMGKNWDHGVPGEIFWREILRVSKPGAYLLAFGGTRTYHRLTVAIEDAGWEIRDCLMWLYGSGFPKSHDISKAIDKAAGAEREAVGVGKGVGKQNPSWNGTAAGRKENSLRPEYDLTAPATPAAQQWDGWGTALKPAWEPIIMARKPLTGTVADNVQTWGTGGINVDACRIGTDQIVMHGGGRTSTENWRMTKEIGVAHTGRWPANLLLDEEAAAMVGEASRFFYVAKASKRDRDEGLEGMEERDRTARMVASEWKVDARHPERGYTTAPQAKARNFHPTVKPTQLMRYLCRMVTPPNGVVLDPFMGSGSTGKAALLENFRFYGIELQKDYWEVAQRRLEDAASLNI